MQKVYHNIKSKIKDKHTFHVLLLILFFSSFVWLCKVILHGFYPDFSIYYSASKIFASGANPYIDSKEFFSPYIYPPIVLLLFYPFTLLEFEIAQKVWIILNLSLCILTLKYLAKVFDIHFFSKTNLSIGILFFISFPLKFTLGMGQINLIVLFFNILAIHFYKNKRVMFSGIFWGISIMTKIFPLFLFFYFLLKRNKGIAKGILTVGIISVILTFILIPSTTIISFIQKIMPTFADSPKLDYYSQSLGAFIGRGVGVNFISETVRKLVSIFILLYSFIVILKNKKENFQTVLQKISVLIILSVILNGYAWQHHYVFLLVPFCSTYFVIKKNKLSKKYYLLLILSYLTVSVNFKDPQILPTILRSHVLIGSLVLLFIQLNLLIDKVNLR